MFATILGQHAPERMGPTQRENGSDVGYNTYMLFWVQPVASDFVSVCDIMAHWSSGCTVMLSIQV